MSKCSTGHGQEICVEEGTTKKWRTINKENALRWKTQNLPLVPHHHEWTIHKPTECKKLRPRMGKKDYKNKKAIKRQNFKDKKQAYIQAKAAYQAYLGMDSDEEQDSMDSDNDEGSNQSESSYSSKGSNTSGHDGCEERRPIPPHATHLFILIYWKQLLKWMTYYTTITFLLTYILIQGIYNGASSAIIWIYYMYQSKHTRKKSLQN